MLDVESVPVGDEGEQLCTECHSDLRGFKRSRHIDLLVASSLQQSTISAIEQEWPAVKELISEWHADDPGLYVLPNRESRLHERP